MKMIARLCAGLGATFLALSIVAPAQAATFQSWVSGTGNDANTASNCFRNTPCETFSAALTVTAPGGVVTCMDSGDTVGPVVISISVTIDCTGNHGSILANSGSGNGIEISGSGIDVTIRGLTIFAGTASHNGIVFSNGRSLKVENVEIFGFAGIAIKFNPSASGSQLLVTDTIIRNNGSPGIVAAAAAPGIVVLDNVRSANNSYGIAVAAGNSVVVNRSVMSGNTTAGVIGDPGAQVVVNNSTISHNSTGVISNQSVRLSNNDIAFNTTAVSGSSGTFGNNRFSGNGTIDTAPAALGGASADLGQQ